MTKLFKIILRPFSILYGITLEIRNFLFQAAILNTHRFPIPILCVGNITVGGTGKTPHTECIIEALRQRFRVACLSRGYKRKTSGFVLATPQSTAFDIGDEPLQIQTKFPDIIVACDADRVRGIRKLLAMPQPPEVIVLDDAFQHRYVQADKNIVLIDYNQPVTDDCLLPAGRLRERTTALKRADYLIVTKCPRDISPIERRLFYKYLKIKPYQQLFFSTIKYGDITSLFPGQTQIHPDKTSAILCLTGIAHPELYLEHLKTFTLKVTELRYPDHHHFTPKDIQQIADAFHTIGNEEKYIFTTEKDAARLRSCELPDEIKQHIYYIPVIPEFLKTENQFLNEITEYVRKNKK